MAVLYGNYFMGSFGLQLQVAHVMDQGVARAILEVDYIGNFF